MERWTFLRPPVVFPPSSHFFIVYAVTHPNANDGHRRLTWTHIEFLTTSGIDDHKTADLKASVDPAACFWLALLSFQRPDEILHIRVSLSSI